MNPNQVYQSGLKNSKANLVDAKAICLMECPNPAADGLNFVCDYPEGDIHLSVDDWINRDYDYFEFLSPDMRNSSLQLQGPCYPVIFPTVNGKIYSAVILCCLLNIRTNQCGLAYSFNKLIF
jgi:choline transporter-like protein 2/4/5